MWLVLVEGILTGSIYTVVECGMQYTYSSICLGVAQLIFEEAFCSNKIYRRL